MKHCELCLCKFCSKAKTECDNCLMCIGTPNQKPISICPNYNNPMASLAGLRAKCGILDDYREPDPDEESIEDILDKIFNKDESQD